MLIEPKNKDMKERIDIVKEILFYLNSIGVVWHQLEGNYYLLLFNKQREVVILGDENPPNKYRLRLSKQGIKTHRLGTVYKTKCFTGNKPKMPQWKKMLNLFEVSGGEITTQLAEDEGINHPYNIVRQLRDKGHEISSINCSRMKGRKRYYFVKYIYISAPKPIAL